MTFLLLTQPQSHNINKTNISPLYPGTRPALHLSLVPRHQADLHRPLYLDVNLGGNRDGTYLTSENQTRPFPSGTLHRNPLRC